MVAPVDPVDPVDLVRRCEAALLALPELRPQSAVASASGPLAHAPTGDHQQAESSVDDQSHVLQCLQSLRRLLLGQPGQAPDPEAVDAAVDAGCAEGALLEAMVTRLPALQWQGRKEVALAWSAMLPHAQNKRNGNENNEEDRGDGGGEASQEAEGEEQGQGELKGLGFMEGHLELVDRLVQGYLSSSDLAIHSGLMLRDTLRSELITRHVLEHGLDTILGACEAPNFDVATDAFTTLKELLRRHKRCTATFLSDNYTTFFEHYHNLLLSSTYITRRQAVKVLGELLLERGNMGVMVKYVSEKENLKLVMTLLKDPSKAIQFEAFHVFKIFVANPKRPESVTKLLVRNRERLLKFLGEFTPAKEEDDFEEEKEMIIEQLQEIGES